MSMKENSEQNQLQNDHKNDFRPLSPPKTPPKYPKAHVKIDDEIKVIKNKQKIHIYSKHIDQTKAKADKLILNSEEKTEIKAIKICKLR